MDGLKDSSEAAGRRLLRNPHPGDILREEFMEPLRLTAYRLPAGKGTAAT